VILGLPLHVSSQIRIGGDELPGKRASVGASEEDAPCEWQRFATIGVRVPSHRVDGVQYEFLLREFGYT
jgi:hypothetical protein